MIIDWNSGEYSQFQNYYGLGLVVNWSSRFRKVERFLISVITSQYRQVQPLTTEYRLVQAITSQYRKVIPITTQNRVVKTITSLYRKVKSFTGG